VSAISQQSTERHRVRCSKYLLRSDFGSSSMTRRATREAPRKQTTNKDKKRSCEGEETVTEHPWIKSYPPGVRWDADIPLMPVQQILENSASQWPDNPAVDFMGRKISYRELNDLSNRAASGFQKLGVKPGVHVGLYLPNTPHYLISLFGILKAGGTISITRRSMPRGCLNTRSRIARPTSWLRWILPRCIRKWDGCWDIPG
jgi:non-ribosomal peptide synthetase component F